MNYDYLTRIRNLIRLQTCRRTDHFVEGEFRSVYRGRSMDFDEIREYAPGDNVSDIDWKATSRSGKTLVRTYTAEKKHNILFIGDCGRKMNADTAAGEAKSDLAVLSFGVAAYLASLHGDDFAMLRGSRKSLSFSGFRSGEGNFQRMLGEYEKAVTRETEKGPGVLLQYAAETFRRKMIIFLITDLPGAEELQPRLLREISVNADLYVMVVGDGYLTGNGGPVYDCDAGIYASPFFDTDGKLAKAERQNQKEREDRVSHLLKQYHAGVVKMDRESEILDGIRRLTGEH